MLISLCNCVSDIADYIRQYQINDVPIYRVYVSSNVMATLLSDVNCPRGYMGRGFQSIMINSTPVVVSRSLPDNHVSTDCDIRDTWNTEARKILIGDGE